MRSTALVLLVLSGCTASVQSLHFRAPVPHTVFERLIHAVGTHCHGVEAIDQAGGFVMSKWKTWPLEEGAMLSRCVATLSTEQGEAFTEVQVAFVTKYCAAPGSFEADGDSPDGCSVVTEMPEKIATAITTAAEQLEADLRR